MDSYSPQMKALSLEQQLSIFFLLGYLSLLNTTEDTKKLFA